MIDMMMLPKPLNRLAGLAGVFSEGDILLCVWKSMMNDFGVLWRQAGAAGAYMSRLYRGPVEAMTKLLKPQQQWKH